MGVFTTKKAIAELSFRLGELSVDVLKLKTANKQLGLEWEELYDKVRHQMARMSRRAKVDAPENGELPTEETPDDGVDPISRSILRRRGMPRMK